MKYKVLLYKDLHETGKNLLKEHGCEVVIAKGSSLEEMRDDLADADALFVRNEPVMPEIMDAAPKLKVIAKHGVGYDNINVEYATKKGIQVVYAPKGNSESVADMTMLLILGCARRLRYTQNEFAKGNYNVRFTLSDTHQLSGMTLGLIGCGNIAKQVARRAYFGFGMKVIGYNRHPKPDLAEYGISAVSSREEVLRAADFVSLHIPSSPETRGSIGTREFELMKNTAYLINTSRGDIVREAELIEAVKHGEIAGAGLDVFAQEPIPADHPLLKMEEVLLTPHVSGMTIEASMQLSRTGAEGILEVLEHRPLTWPVNDLHAKNE